MSLVWHIVRGILLPHVNRLDGEGFTYAGSQNAPPGGRLRASPACLAFARRRSRGYRAAKKALRIPHYVIAPASTKSSGGWLLSIVQIAADAADRIEGSFLVGGELILGGRHEIESAGHLGNIALDALQRGGGGALHDWCALRCLGERSQA
jgi:hypothetical protein